MNKWRMQMEGEMEMKGVIFPKTMPFGNYEYQIDLRVINNLEKVGSGNPNFHGEVRWSAGIQYFISRNISLMGSYDNRFGVGGVLSIRF